MQHSLGGDAPKPRTSRSSRSSSVGSDAVPSPIVSSLRAVPAAKPSPAYVAAAAAAELVTNNRQLALEEAAYDLSSPPSPDHNDSASFSTAGLAMINAFLDQLLYNFLFHARGTTLAALRQSVEQVLKGKLAAYAISSADEELEELLNEELDDDLAAVHESASGNSKGDVEAIFWRTRLRVMVYMRLGEMEDEDEEVHVDEAQAILHKGSLGSANKRLSLNTGLVSWAAAIFLTSILEFVAEQCLNCAGQAAFDRVAGKRKNKGDALQEVEEEDEVIVEEHDTERVALSSTLGRLWRTWRKGLRTTHSRNISLAKSNASSRKPSASAIRPDLSGRLPSHNGSIATRGTSTFDEAARINAVRIYRISQRPRSLVVESSRAVDQRRNLPSTSSPDALQLGRTRAKSLPNPGRTPLLSPTDLTVHNEERPSTAPRAEDNYVHDAYVDALPVPTGGPAAFSPLLEQAEEDSHPIAEARIPKRGVSLDQNRTATGQKAPSFLDRAAATRMAVPIPQESTPLRSDVAQTRSAEQASAGSTESLTSIDEDFESQTAVSTDATEVSRAVTSGLGISSGSASHQPPDEVPLSTYTAPYQPRMLPRSPQYHEQHVVRAVKSFDREDRATVRRLSNSSSKHAKSISSAKNPSKRSQEAIGSPQSAATSKSGYFEKGFGDFVAGQETVKLTLTPRTLQEIESPDSPRYRVKETARIKDENRKQTISDQDLAAAQQAVIASMNASLKSYTPSGEKSQSPVSSTFPTKLQQAPPPVPRKPVADSIPVQSGGALREVRVPAEAVPDQLQGAKHTRISSNQQPRVPPPAPPSTGWFSARASSESPRSMKTNGSGSVKNKANAVLQPREAVVTRRGENADLVAFLRSTGPPGPQLYTGANDRASSSMTQSAHGSVNSRSGLIASNASRTVAAGRAVSSPVESGDASGGPTRTRRRIKDPYALPSDDEGDEGLTALPTRGESLVDFLRNVAPPPHMTTGGAALPPTRASTSGTSEARDGKLLNGVGRAGNSPSSPASPQSKTLKGKGSVKSFWKKIGV